VAPSQAAVAIGSQRDGVWRSRQHVVVIREPRYGYCTQWSTLASFLSIRHFSTRRAYTFDWTVAATRAARPTLPQTAVAIGWQNDSVRRSALTASSKMRPRFADHTMATALNGPAHSIPHDQNRSTGCAWDSRRTVAATVFRNADTPRNCSWRHRKTAIRTVCWIKPWDEIRCPKKLFFVFLPGQTTISCGVN